MKALEKINLIRNIAEELEKLFDYREVEIFLSQFNLPNIDVEDYNNITFYVKDRMKYIKDSDLKEISDELSIDTTNLIKTPPRNWENTTSVKAFISHTSKNKKLATRLRDVLKFNNIEAFVAHEDIKPSEEWQQEIQKALNTMDFFISMHTEDFSKSIWCQQEIGYAHARGTKIIPIKFDEDPQGFIHKYQAIIRNGRSAEDISKEILGILKDDNKTKEIYQLKIAQKFDVEDEVPF